MPILFPALLTVASLYGPEIMERPKRSLLHVIALQQAFTLTLDNLAAGTYQVTAKVTTTDPANPVLHSAPLAVTVGTPPGAATAYFIHTDQLDTPRAITNGSGNLVWQWDSDPFGKDAANEQPAGQPAFTFNQRFPGQQFDRESNLNYNYFRDYDPALGRYVESDLIGLLGGMNTYGYVGGNPISGLDPLGLANLNLFNPNPGSHDYESGAYAGGNAWNIGGAYTVAGHGNPGNMEDDRNGYRALWPEDLAKIIKNDPAWKGKPVVLGSCNVGNAWPDGHGGRARWDSFAQSLANILGVPVTAPHGFARYDAQKGLLGSTPKMSSPVVPGDPGRWSTAYPR